MVDSWNYKERNVWISFSC